MSDERRLQELEKRDARQRKKLRKLSPAELRTRVRGLSREELKRPRELDELRARRLERLRALTAAELSTYLRGVSFEAFTDLWLRDAQGDLRDAMTEELRRRRGSSSSRTRSVLKGVLASSASMPAQRSAPPIGARFVLDLFLSKTDREVIPGDLEEEFTISILPKYGPRRAHFWFWTQAVRTIGTRNAICRWVLVGGLVRFGEWIFRKIG